MTAKKYFIFPAALVMMFAVFVPRAHAAISLDASSTFGFSSRATATTTAVVHSGSNEILLMCVAANAVTITPPTVNGTPMTLLSSSTHSTKQAALFYLSSAPVGTDNISSTFSGASAGGFVITSLFGVASTPVDVTSTNTGTSANPSSSITTTVANDWVVDCNAHPNTSATTAHGAGQNVIGQDISSSATEANSSYVTSTSPTTIVNSWTYAGSQLWVSIQAALVPSGAPDATSVSTTMGGDGGRSGDSITVSGVNFGTVATSNAATCNGGAGTGCVEFITGGTDIVPSSSITSWSSTSIVFTIPATLKSNGGAAGLQVWAANASDTTPLTFYIYPRISTVLSIQSNAARIYNAGDTDGVIMLSGDHFGTTTGTSSILGFLATLYNTTGGSCSVAGFASTTACFEVPTGIATNTYTGNIILTRASDSKQASTTANSFSILPRILAVNPVSTSTGNIVQIIGDHLCQSGTCPLLLNRSTSTTNVAFGSTIALNSDFVSQTGGSGVCNGSGAAWQDGEICVKVPVAAATGSAPIVVTSNINTSTAASFTVTPPAPPGTTTAPTYTSVSSNSLTVNWTAASGMPTYYKIQRATSTQVFVQIATTTATSSPDSGLSQGTTYYYRIVATNAGGDGSPSASSSVTTSAGNSPPNAPTLAAPSNGAQGVATSPVFQMTATDPDGDAIQYEVVLYTDSGCTATSSIYNESSTQSGWSGQNATSSSQGDSYLSGSQGTYTLQSTLPTGTVYYWAAMAKDPLGTNSWGASSACYGFTTTSGKWTVDSGNWNISSGSLGVSSTASTVQLHVTGANYADAVVEYLAERGGILTNGKIATITHASGTNNYSFNYFSQDFISKTDNNVSTTIASSSYGYSGETTYDFRQSVSSIGGSQTSLASWINGGTPLSKTDSNTDLSGAGSVGLTVNGSSLFSFSDFAIYKSTVISVSGLQDGSSWAILDSQGNKILGCQTGSSLDLSTYSGQIPIDYARGGGSIVAWLGASNCPTSGSGPSSSVKIAYPSSGLATDIFGGDSYSINVNPGGTVVGGGTILATSSITVNSAGSVSF